MNYQPCIRQSIPYFSLSSYIKKNTFRCEMFTTITIVAITYSFGSTIRVILKINVLTYSKGDTHWQICKNLYPLQSHFFLGYIWKALNQKSEQYLLVRCSGVLFLLHPLFSFSFISGPQKPEILLIVSHNQLHNACFWENSYNIRLSEMKGLLSSFSFHS